MDKKLKKFIDFLIVLNSGQEIPVNDHRMVLGYSDDGNAKISMVFIQYEGTDGDCGREVLIEPPLLQDLNNLIDYVNKNLDDSDLEKD